MTSLAENATAGDGPTPLAHFLDFSRFNPSDYPIEDCDEEARIQRALEIAEGVEPPPGYTPTSQAFQSSSKNSVSQQKLPTQQFIDHTKQSKSGTMATAAVAAVATAAAAASSSSLSQFHMPYTSCSTDVAIRQTFIPNFYLPQADEIRIHSQVSI